jgi:hypothetical protein
MTRRDWRTMTADERAAWMISTAIEHVRLVRELYREDRPSFGPGPRRGRRRIEREAVGTLRRALSWALISSDLALRVRVREALAELGRRGDGRLLATRREDVAAGDPVVRERRPAGVPSVPQERAGHAGLQPARPRARAAQRPGERGGW